MESEVKISRQQRKQMIKEEVKQKVNSQYQPTQQSFVTVETMNKLVMDVQRVLNYAKLVDNHVWMLVETLSRKGVLNWDTVNETEKLYLKKEEDREKRVKELLEKTLSVKEYLNEIKEDSSLPGYEKLSINPVKDLNLNPFEVGACLKEENPTFTEEEFLTHYNSWGLASEHFGFPGQTGSQG